MAPLRDSNIRRTFQTFPSNKTNKSITIIKLQDGKCNENVYEYVLSKHGALVCAHFTRRPFCVAQPLHADNCRFAISTITQIARIYCTKNPYKTYVHIHVCMYFLCFVYEHVRLFSKTLWNSVSRALRRLSSAAS